MSSIRYPRRYKDEEILFGIVGASSFFNMSGMTLSGIAGPVTASGSIIGSYVMVPDSPFIDLGRATKTVRVLSSPSSRNRLIKKLIIRPVQWTTDKVQTEITLKIGENKHVYSITYIESVIYLNLPIAPGETCLVEYDEPWDIQFMPEIENVHLPTDDLDPRLKGYVDSL